MPGAETRTFRGRSLEEILPRIRSELGPDAVVVRRREGLAGGVGGFFQKQFVEVEARSGAPLIPDDLADRVINRAAAHAEGMRAPAIQALVDSAAPFAEQLERAERQGEGPPASNSSHAGLYGPQPTRPEAAMSPVPPPPPVIDAPGHDLAPLTSQAHSPRLEPTLAEALADAAAHQQQHATSDEHLDLSGPPAPVALGRRRPQNAEAVERRLVAGGLSPALAATVVGEAVSHGLPFTQARQFKRLIRQTLARRIPIMTALPPGGRFLAVVGTGGAGKTQLCARLATAYAQGSDLPVVVLTLRPEDGGAGLARLLEPAGISVQVVDNHQEARARIAGTAEVALCLLDTPGISPRKGDAVRALGAELERIRPSEVHLALPATTSGPAARELLTAFAPLAASHIALTYADVTEHAGAVVDVAIALDKPLSYISSGTGAEGLVEPADPSALATSLLP